MSLDALAQADSPLSTNKYSSEPFLSQVAEGFLRDAKDSFWADLALADELSCLLS